MAIAIGMVEFSSIARGIYAADQMVKISEVEIVTAQTICPGKYIALVEGDVAAVQDSVHIGEKFAGEYFVDSLVIPNVHHGIFPAITDARACNGTGHFRNLLCGYHDHCSRPDPEGCRAGAHRDSFGHWPGRQVLLHLHW